MSSALAPAARGFVIDRGDGRPQLAQWLSLADAGVVHAFTGKAELGQGILTALRLIDAAELGVALDRVQLQPASTARGPDEGVTAGSLSVQDSGGALRHACAELRGIALDKATARAGVAAAEL